MLDLAHSEPSLARRLAAYSAIGGAFLLTGSPAQAGVVYTDVDPDVTIDGFGSPTLFDVDFDGGGAELRIFAGGNYLGLGMFTNNAIVGGSGDPNLFCYPYPLSSGSVVGGGGGYGGNFACNGAGFSLGTALNYYSTRGLWQGGNESGFLAVRFEIGGQQHYGWIHLIGVSQSQATITGFAYEDTPGATIGAGTTPVELMRFSID